MALSKIVENSITDGVVSSAKLKDFSAAVDLNGVELILDADQDTSITADTDDQIDIKISGADDFRFTANTFTALAGSGVVIPDSGLTLGSTAVTTTAAELNLIDGGTARGTTALASGDGILINDGGTMRMTNVDTVQTFMQSGLSSTLASSTDVSMDITNFVDSLLIQTDSDGSAPTTGTLSTATGNIGIGKSVFGALTSGDYNTAIGYNAMPVNTTGGNNTAIAAQALLVNTTGGDNVAVGKAALYANTTGGNNTSLGRSSLRANTTASNNVAVGYQALDANTTASNNTAVGYASLGANTTGASNVALGTYSLDANTTASSNTAVGYASLSANTTGRDNTALGFSAGVTNTTGLENTAIGMYALRFNTTGATNTAVGLQALHRNTTASNNTAIGRNAMEANTTGTQNVAVGALALDANTTASYHTAVGYKALSANTTGAQNTAVGVSALQSNTTSSYNVAVGYQTLYSNTTAGYNLAIGYQAGYNTTGSRNTYVGFGSGSLMTTGANNTIIGQYNGNAGGLDIRTSSNNIVLSDGSGNPRGYFSSVGAFHIDKTPFGGGTGIYLNNTNSQAWIGMRFQTGGSTVGYISVGTSSTSYVTSSDYRLKENVEYTWDATTRLKQLKPARFNFIADADTTVDGFLAHEAQAVVPECVTGAKDAVDADGNAVMQGIDQSKLVPPPPAALQEALAEIASLKTRVEALE